MVWSTSYESNQYQLYHMNQYSIPKVILLIYQANHPHTNRPNLYLNNNVILCLPAQQPHLHKLAQPFHLDRRPCLSWKYRVNPLAQYQDRYPYPYSVITAVDTVNVSFPKNINIRHFKYPLKDHKSEQIVKHFDEVSNIIHKCIPFKIVSPQTWKCSRSLRSRGFQSICFFNLVDYFGYCVFYR